MTETTYVPAAPGKFAYHIEFARSTKESLLETTEGDILVDEYAVIAWGSLFATPIFAVRCSRGPEGLFYLFPNNHRLHMWNEQADSVASDNIDHAKTCIVNGARREWKRQKRELEGLV